MIDARIVEVSNIEARLMEITENLHRAELTALERSEQLAEWVRLTEAKQEESLKPTGDDDKVVQLGPVSMGGRGNEGGVRAAARKLGVKRAEAIRAQEIAKLPEEVKQAAREAGIDDNQSALLRVAGSADEPQNATVKSYRLKWDTISANIVEFDDLHAELALIDKTLCAKSSRGLALL